MLITEDNVFSHRRDPYCLYIRVPYGEGEQGVHVPFPSRARRWIVYSLANWRGGLECSRWAGGWSPLPLASDPGLVLLNEQSARCAEGPLAAFLERIPAAAREVAKPFRHLQLTALRLLRLNPRAADLAQDCPALFWLLCRDAGRNFARLPAAAAAADLKRRDIVRRLLRDDCVLTPEFFRRVRFHAFDSDELDGLTAFVCAEKGNRTVLHWRTIDPRTLRECYLPGRPRLPPRVLAQCQEEGIDGRQMANLLTLFTDARKMHERLHGEAGGRDIGSAMLTWRDRHDVVRFHDRLVGETAHGWKEGNLVRFPQPHLPGSEHIVPLRDSHELWEEGRVMLHCVYAYLEDILAGAISVYKVLRPQRATLAIGGSRLFSPRLLECALHANDAPNEETMRAVEAWMGSASRPKGEAAGRKATCI